MKEDLHHLIKSTQLVAKCIYCGKLLEKEKWTSEMYQEKHYKKNNCNSCGKLTKITVNFEGSLGSGEDSWIDRMLKLDDIIK